LRTAPVRRANPAVFQEALTSATRTRIKGVELVRVGLAADGGFINIQYRMPPREARALRQGRVSVIDEATGRSYREIPMMPKVGPLISRPKREGQVGSVMLVNAPSRIGKGSQVTVTLGNFRQEHVPVE
jgi:hypothetical protein